MIAWESTTITYRKLFWNFLWQSSSERCVFPTGKRVIWRLFYVPNLFWEWIRLVKRSEACRVLSMVSKSVEDQTGKPFRPWKAE